MNERNPKKKWNLLKYKVQKTSFQYPLMRQAKITRRMLEIIGEEMVKGVRYEAMRAAGLGTGMPSTSDFLDSFGYEIVGDDSIRITSDWKWVAKYLKAKEPYKMDWLTQQKGAPKIIPMKDKYGEVVFRTAPLLVRDSWIHPAIHKYNFIDRGVERGLRSSTRRILFELKEEFLQ